MGVQLEDPDVYEVIRSGLSLRAPTKCESEGGE